jgi:glutamate N-acetyltransferase/amino-acid N-acetyltransferase
MTDTKTPPGITAPKGFRAAGVHCGVKKDPRKNDLTLIVCDVPAAAAGVFTRNRACAGPVTVSRQNLRTSGGRVRFVVANSGNANAATGDAGIRDAARMVVAVSEWFSAQAGHSAPGRVDRMAEGWGVDKGLVCSTGLIGIPLPMEKIEAGIAAACQALSAGPAADEAAARGILTTDNGPKTAGAAGRIGGKAVTVAAIAKGAAMIAPDMATMLCFVTTDLAISPKILQGCLKVAVDRSFNTITVDGHTSTNDTVLALASGLAGNPEIKKADDPELAKFQKLLDKVCLDLALMMVRDGEGADKLCEIAVEGAATDKEARAIARALSDSPLWKCALTAGHPNWGRIVCAAGNVMSRGGPEDLTVKLGKVKVFAAGEPVKADPAKLDAAMAEDPVRVHIGLTHGEGSALVRTCDINHKYIEENTGKST